MPVQSPHVRCRGTNGRGWGRGSKSGNDSKRSFGASFDHLVGDRKYRRRHLDAEHSRRLQIDDEIELGRLQHWQVDRPRALDNAAGIDADLMKRFREIGSAAHQHAGRDKVTLRASRRNFVRRRQDGKLHGAARKERVASDEERIGALARASR